MIFSKVLARLAALTVARVMAAWRALPAFDFAPAGALLVARSNIQAASAADVALAATVDAPPLGLGRPEDDLPRLEAVMERIVTEDPLAGLAEEEARIAAEFEEEIARSEREWEAFEARSAKRLQARVAEIEEASQARQRERVRDRREAARMRIERLARTEPMNAGRHAFSAAMQATPQVVGWRRRLNEGACQLCQWWGRGGETFPVDKGLRSHPNCLCVAEPVLEVVNE